MTMLSRRTTLVAAAGIATSAMMPSSVGATAAADTARIAALEAENAALVAKNADLRLMADMFIQTMRELPEGNYSLETRCFRLVARAEPEEACAIAASLTHALA